MHWTRLAPVQSPGAGRLPAQTASGGRRRCIERKTDQHDTTAGSHARQREAVLIIAVYPGSQPWGTSLHRESCTADWPPLHSCLKAPGKELLLHCIHLVPQPLALDLCLLRIAARRRHPQLRSAKHREGVWVDAGHRAASMAARPEPQGVFLRARVALGAPPSTPKRSLTHAAPPPRPRPGSQLLPGAGEPCLQTPGGEWVG